MDQSTERQPDYRGQRIVAGGVPTYSLSLDMSAAGHAGSFGYPSLELQFTPAEIAAFNANSYLTFTFSVPSGSSTSGYSQIYNLAFNSGGTGYFNALSGGNAAATWGTYTTATGSTGNNQNGNPTSTSTAVNRRCLRKQSHLTMRVSLISLPWWLVTRAISR